MFVKNQMTANPFTATPSTTVPEAHAIMETHGVRHLPVLENGKLVGVVSQGDIAAASPSKATTFSVGEITYLLSKLTVGKIMTRNPHWVTPDTLLEQVAVIMRDNKIEMLPVLDDGKLVGVITESAILDSFIDILGFRNKGTRLTIEATDAPGVLSSLTSITARYGANITHVAVYRGHGDTSTVVVGMNSLNTDAIEADLAAEGFKVIAKLQNR